jgi:hypothetical protein
MRWLELEHLGTKGAPRSMPPKILCPESLEIPQGPVIQSHPNHSKVEVRNKRRGRMIFESDYFALTVK